MPQQQLEMLRNLRKKAIELNSTIVSDLMPFQHLIEKGTFRRKPTKESIKSDVSITSTCSCLMALAVSDQLYNYYEKDDNNKPDDISKIDWYKNSTKESFQKVFESKWESSSSELSENNSFTIALVLRTLGILSENNNIDKEEWKTKSKSFMEGLNKSFLEIVRWLIEDLDNFKINKYPKTAAIIYWFIDGISKCEINLDNNKWINLFSWANGEFLHQQSLVLAQHDALMDPVAMAMAACLCRRLRKIAENNLLGAESKDTFILPSVAELEHSVLELFKKQTPSGIWSKYFPLFHYPKGGSNFCFTFEMLEAVLVEFGGDSSSLLEHSSIYNGMQKALEWCEKNRLKYTVKNGDKTNTKDLNYDGWNSGGEIESLSIGEPEAWATAVVHMFLWELQYVLSKRIQNNILCLYGTKPAKSSHKNWDELIDIDIELSGEPITIKTILENKVFEKAKKYEAFKSREIDEDSKISVLLFGPPGTSKTRLVRAFADKLEWPIVEIEPSHFLTKGIENIYIKANEIFEDLADLSRVVVFFDEMDALVRTRDEQHGPLDVTSRFLTTCMLPKLARLHDDRRVIFFFATNYQEFFDQAIKRPGRFDILLQVRPPLWERKTELLALKNLLNKNDKNNSQEVKNKLDELTANCCKPKKEKLDLMTFAETKNFFSYISSDNVSLITALETMDKPTFYKRLNEFAKTMTLQKDNDEYKRFMTDKEVSKYQ